MIRLRREKSVQMEHLFYAIPDNTLGWKKRENSTTMDNEYFSKKFQSNIYVCLNCYSSKKKFFFRFQYSVTRMNSIFTNILFFLHKVHCYSSSCTHIVYTYCISAFWKLNRIILSFRAQLFAKENFFTWFQLNFISEFF